MGSCNSTMVLERPESHVRDVSRDRLPQDSVQLSDDPARPNPDVQLLDCRGMEGATQAGMEGGARIGKVEEDPSVRVLFQWVRPGWLIYAGGFSLLWETPVLLLYPRVWARRMRVAACVGVSRLYGLRP